MSGLCIGARKETKQSSILEIETKGTQQMRIVACFDGAANA